MKQITCLIPCLNEEKTIATCVEEAFHYLRQADLDGEVLVADNGSTDRSIALASQAGARVINVAHKGYGNALLGGIDAAESDFIVMADADQTYEWKDLSTFYKFLDQGFDLVMGNRFSGNIEKNAMPVLNRYFGNPILSFIGKIFFDTKIKDFHCGLRGFKKSKMQALNLTSSGMEFASEIVIKSSLAQLKITEIPTTLRVPPFDRKPHLRPFRDGWRHLRLMLSYAPKFAIALPSILALVFGLFIFSVLYFNEGKLFAIKLKEHSLLVSSVFIFMGLQGVFSWFIAEYSLFNNKVKFSMNRFFSFVQKSKILEFFLLAGLITFFLGLYLNINAFNYWQSLAFGNLATFELLTKIGPGFILMVFGLQFIFSSFMLETIKTSQRK